MPSKKKKYNARFPAGRIKKIMQTDEDVGKVAQAVPVIISRTLELFVESLLKRAVQITSAKNAKTLTPSHMKQCILSESRFDFLKDLVRGIPDVSSVDEEPVTPVGIQSPGVVAPLPGKSAGSYSCFQFRRKSDGGNASKSTSTTSQLSSVPQAPLPKFYNEIAIGDDTLNKEEEEVEEEEGDEVVSSRTPVVQHIGSRFNHRSPVPNENNDVDKSLGRTLTASNQLSRPSESKFTVNNVHLKGSGVQNEDGDEDEDDDEDDDEFQENGYHRLRIVTKTCSIDEDYDT